MTRRIAGPRICYKCREAPRTTGAYCRRCASDYERDRRRDNADEINARKRASYDPIARRRATLAGYGLTADDEIRLLEAQGGVCAICRGGRPLHVDHDHACCPRSLRSCGKCVRGLLCSSCNNGLGRFADDPEVLLRAVEYLRRDTARDEAFAKRSGSSR